MPKSELWLSLDLSAAHGTLAFHEWSEDESPRLLLEAVVGEGFDHSERLLDTLTHALDKIGKQLGDIDRFITVSGPGSFTGMRIAYAAFKAFTLATGATFETVGAGEARALGWLQENESEASFLNVVARVSTTRQAVSRFRINEDRTVEMLGEMVEAFTEPMPSPDLEWLGSEGHTGGHKFPLSARHIGRALPRAKTRRAHDDIEQWIAASPEYLGSSF